MATHIWDTCNNGSIQIVSMTAAHLQGAIDVLRGSLFLHESICVGVELRKHPQAIKDMEDIFREAAKDGISVVAVETNTGKVAGVVFNKLHVKTAGPGFYGNFLPKCKHHSSREFVRCVMAAESVVDLYEKADSDCLFEIMLLATLPQFRDVSVGEKMCVAAFTIAEKLASGENVKVSLTGEKLSNDVSPTLVFGLVTSFISQKIGRTLGYTKVGEIRFDKLFFDGKTFASRIGPQSPTADLIIQKIRRRPLLLSKI